MLCGGAHIQQGTGPDIAFFVIKTHPGTTAEYQVDLVVIVVRLHVRAAGSTDMQAHHDDDEVYLVLSGRARMRLDDEERDVGPGSLLYVSATTEHSFFEIEEDMTLLVLFSPTPLELNQE